MVMLLISAVSPAGGVPSSPPQLGSPPHNSADLPPSINLDMLDTEALITVEVFIVSANAPSNEGSGKALQTVSVHFNNLDIIGTVERALCLNLSLCKRLLNPCTSLKLLFMFIVTLVLPC